MAHGILDEFVGIGAAIVSAFFASQARGLAEGGISPKAGEVARGVVMQRLPKMFGFGRTDERLFESLRQLLDAPIRHLIDLVINEMKDYEADIFRLTVTGMSCGSELADDPVKDPKKGQPVTTKKTVSWEMTKKDLRVKYLADIADEVSKASATLGEKAAVTRVVADMRARRLITRSPTAQKAYDLWVDATEWTEKNILRLLGVNSFDEITPDMIAGYVNVLAGKMKDRQVADVNLGFWRGNYRRYPIRTIGMAISIIAVLVSSILITNT